MSQTDESSVCSHDGDEISAWDDVTIDLDALQRIVCQVFRLPTTECGPPVAIAHDRVTYGRIYTFKLPTLIVVARLVAPIKPVFKTESEVAAMDFVRSRTSLPVPKVFAYSSEANNPVGAEWLIKEYMPGVEMSIAWRNLALPQKRRLARDLIDLHDQLFRLKADGCGSIYHSVGSVDDFGLLTKSISHLPETEYPKSLRWMPLSAESLRMLRSHCNHSIRNFYQLGPLNDISLMKYQLDAVPSPSQTLPVFTSEEYVKLIAFNGNPPTISTFDFPTRERVVELFRSTYNLNPNSTVLGPSADASNFRFSHGDLHDSNILIDPQSGVITGIIDWETAAFRPLWSKACDYGWFKEDEERFLFGALDARNFEDDTDPDDAVLRAFFRTAMFKRNPDLFSCFLGGIELRAVLYAAGDFPRPRGETEVFLSEYHWLGYWTETRRGAFPWDMDAWRRRRLELDKVELDRGTLKLQSMKLAQEGKEIEEAA